MHLKVLYFYAIKEIMRQKMRKVILIAVMAAGIICAAVISYGLFTQRDAIPSQDLALSDYPKLFEKEAVIVIGENASQIEKESAEAIAANLENLTGNKPEIVNTKEIESFKHAYNLIIVGTPKTNPLLEEVYALTNATRVTEEYPGEGKGVLEILSNPWDESKAMLLVEGSDAVGVNIMGQITFQTEKIHLKQVYGPYEGKKSETGMIGLPNPSAVYCENLGYRYEIRTKSDGSQLGFCIFDGEECPCLGLFQRVVR